MTENLCAVKHHLLTSDGTEQAFTADAIVKFANADPHAAQKLRRTLEQLSSERHQSRVNERVDRAISHIESQINTRGPPYSDQIEESTSNQDENTPPTTVDHRCELLCSVRDGTSSHRTGELLSRLWRRGFLRMAEQSPPDSRFLPVARTAACIDSDPTQ